MIDTDKYEGHTEGEWDLHSMGDGWTIGQLRKIDRTLMQDAPLLLAEVKRLRRVLEDIESMIPDNHEEVSPILSDILSECHRVLPMFYEVKQ
jgi:hypothetical protein